MLRLIIFDFDGVIADTEPAHFEMFRQTFENEGIRFQWDQYCEKYLGYDDRECIEHVLRDHRREPSSALINRLATLKKQKFAQYLHHHSVIMPGVADLLAGLLADGIVCSICSGALRPEIEFILEQANLQPNFAGIVAAEDVQAGKPDPQGYHLSLARTNALLDGQPEIDPAHCLVIEDSLWGIQAAKAAQMHCLAVTTSYPAEMLKLADTVVKDLTCANSSYLQKIIAEKHPD